MRKPLLTLVVAMSILPGCNEHPLKLVPVTRESQTDLVVQVNPNRNVDILFVIDNSGSMAEEQGTLARNFEAFVRVLEAESVDANYRIAVTTTDSGNPLCRHSTPEYGNFVMSSCRSRSDEFVWERGNEVDDFRRVACEDACPAEWSTFETTPTTIRGSDDVVARPWLERIDGITNLPEGLSTAQAFACFGPQGVRGCGYEAPLESMLQALARTTTSGEDEHGFLRADALLAIVFVTDEVDCSAQAHARGVFDGSGDRSLWPNEKAPAAPNAVCWAAGVECEVDEDGRRHCEPATVGADGQPAVDEDGVLHPLSRYIDYVESLLEHKRQLRPDAAVLVSVLSGVPLDYRGGELLYPPRDGSTFDVEYGSPPGCESTNGVAVPPVRLRAFAEHFAQPDQQVLYSACAENYESALASIAHALEERFVPACLEQCPADRDFSTAAYEPHCEVHERLPDGEKIPVVWCEGEEDALTLPEGADLCVALARGENRHESCIEGGLPSEFKLLRRPGALRVPGATVEAACSVSDDPERDCGG